MTKRKLHPRILKHNILKTCNEIIALTNQQAKHRQKISEGCNDPHIKRFIKVTGDLIIKYDKELNRLIKDSEGTI